MWINPLDHKLVGECLSEVRRRYNFTQIELARKLGKPQSFVSSYEAGQRRIDILELIKISGAIGENPKIIFDRIMDRIDEER